MFEIAAANRADKMSIRIDEHLTAHMPRRGAFAFHHGAERGRFIGFLKFFKGLINGFHNLLKMIVSDFYGPHCGCQSGSVSLVS